MTRRLGGGTLMWLVPLCVGLILLAVVLAGPTACTTIDWVDKHKPPEVPGEEQARLDRLKKQGGGFERKTHGTKRKTQTAKRT